MTRRKFTKFLLDLLVWSAVVPAAYYLRLDARFWDNLESIGRLTAILVPVQIGFLFLFGMHHQSWHRVSVRDLVRIGAMVCIWSLVQYAAFFFIPTLFVPRSVPVIAGMLSMLALGMLRMTYRIRFERHRQQSHKGEIKRVLVVGAGEAGIMLVREMLKHPESGQMPVGFIDDDANKKNQRILGLQVLGPISGLGQAIVKTGAVEVLIAIPSAPGKVIRRIVDEARAVGTSYRIMPGIYELLSGRVGISQIREVDVEDLLRREPVKLELQEITQYLEQKVVLITGAGGSIGSELVKQVSRFNPKLLVLLGRGENSIYGIEQEIRRLWPNLRYRTVIGDIRDKAKLRQVFELFRPHVVFHAAAHKHVPLMESNVDEAVFNNVGGTHNLVELALEFSVERFVNISTDKAVNPTSVMGATKRVAERIVEWAAQRAAPGQSFVSVRFGNVLGSRGSVIPLFKEQIRRREPLTVTHPEMTRYFMTIPEAAQLVLQAGGMAANGSVYILDMGEPVKIMDLAKDLIQLSGLIASVDIDIVITGLRPGEKLYEELLTEEEGIDATRHAKISVARKRGFSAEEFKKGLDELFPASSSRDSARIDHALRGLVPNYKIQPAARVTSH